LRQRQEIQALLRTVIESGTSGKTGDLREREPLKAVFVYHEALGAPPAPVIRAFALFFLLAHDFQVLHRLWFTSLLSLIWHGYLDQTT
jgi:hypothetical protein